MVTSIYISVSRLARPQTFSHLVKLSIIHRPKLSAAGTMATPYGNWKKRDKPPASYPGNFFV